MLGVILGSRFPMLLGWGPDMLHLYNDAYRPILRDKHPASLAAPAAQVWAEVWDLAGPMARSVLEGGPATWTEDLQLFINSGAMLEETYFTFSYSPVPGDDRPVAEVIRPGRESVPDDVSARFEPLPVGRWSARPEQAILLPLNRAGQSMAHAVLIAGISPHRVFDERYRTFFRTAADQVMTVIANARTYESEKKRAEALAEIDRAKTTFFSNVSHELRTPLTLMLGPLEDALADSEQPLPGSQQSRMRLAPDNALRLVKLATALLDFSRLQAGRMSASYAPLDIAQFTAELAGMFQPAADKGGLKLAVDNHRC